MPSFERLFVFPIIEVMVFHSGKYKKFEAIVEYPEELIDENFCLRLKACLSKWVFHYAYILLEPGNCQVLGRAFMTAVLMFGLVLYNWNTEFEI